MPKRGGRDAQGPLPLVEAKAERQTAEGFEDESGCLTLVDNAEVLLFGS